MVLIVGGAGYIGGAVTNILLERKISFAVFDCLLYERQYLKPVNFIYGDVRDRDKLASILPGFTHVIWLAAIVGDSACNIDSWITEEINTGSIKWLVRNYTGRIVFTSTCSVYGTGNNLLTEKSKTTPLSLYAKSKLDAEAVLASHPNTLVLRLGTAFGVSDNHSRVRLDLVINYFGFTAATKNKIVFFGGTQWRPFIHVKDIAEAIVNNLDKKVTGIYNLATTNCKIEDIAKRVRALTLCEVGQAKHPFWDKRDYHVSTGKAKRAGILAGLSFRSVDVGINDVTDLVKSGRISLNENDEHFNDRYLLNLLNKKEKIYAKTNSS